MKGSIYEGNPVVGLVNMSGNTLDRLGRGFGLLPILMRARKRRAVATRTAVVMTPHLLRTQFRAYQARFPDDNTGNFGKALRQVIFRERRLQLERIAGKPIDFEYLCDPK